MAWKLSHLPHARRVIGRLKTGGKCRNCGRSEKLWVTSLAVDADNNVVVFNRGEHPVIVFDSEGKFVRAERVKAYFGIHTQLRSVLMVPIG